MIDNKKEASFVGAGVLLTGVGIWAGVTGAMHPTPAALFTLIPAISLTMFFVLKNRQ